LIGHLQSNKAKEAVAVFDRIQSVDSLKLLERLDRLAGEAGKSLPILLQCNAGADPRKYGFMVDAMDAALERALAAAHLKVEGLMTIAPFDDAPNVAAQCFERLRELRDRLSAQHGVELRELSMGMTGDLEAAIAAGSTQIRVGTALYGQRARPAE
jgi:pyridoxal phosphate enzyme (YggS family)